MKPRGQTYDGFIATVLDQYEQDMRKHPNAEGQDRSR